jgi:hypothetical protein
MPAGFAEPIRIKRVVRFFFARPFFLAYMSCFASMAGQGRMRTIKAIDFAI